MPPMLSSIITMIDGIRRGTVRYLIFCHLEAPSRDAASYISLSNPAILAR